MQTSTTAAVIIAKDMVGAEERIKLDNTPPKRYQSSIRDLLLSYGLASVLNEAEEAVQKVINQFKKYQIEITEMETRHSQERAALQAKYDLTH